MIWAKGEAPRDKAVHVALRWDRTSMLCHSDARNMAGCNGHTSGKESAYQCRRCRRHEFNPWVGKIPWRRKWQPSPVFLPGKFHGQRSLATVHGIAKESDMTEHTAHSSKTVRIYIVSIFNYIQPC